MFIAPSYAKYTNQDLVIVGDDSWIKLNRKNKNLPKA